MNNEADFAVIGLAVMGANLALNVEQRGFRVAVFNRSPDRTQAILAENPGKNLIPAYSYQELAQKLTRPRRILIMVKAGAPVDATLEGLLPYLEPGDIVIDGGNEFWTNTERRNTELSARGIHFVGMGVSGGEEGARHGPSIMPGGHFQAYQHIEPIVTQIAAQVEDGPCVAYMGPGGAGHYVKMVHNGIEYGDMQLIAEIYDLLKNVGGLSNPELAETFSQWNQGRLQSFLIEITADIFRKQDPGTGQALVDLIVDTAQMKGTGSWTVKEGADLASPIPTIASAVDARILSSHRPLRYQAADILSGPQPSPEGGKDQIVADAEAALWAAKACSYAQGMALLSKASDARKWNLQLGEIARIWKAGCIIRAAFLGTIQAAYKNNPGLPHLLFDPYFAQELAACQDGWRRTVARAVTTGVPAATLTASLSYYDALRRRRLPANLTQAQRDYFGAHTYQRLDQEGSFHTEWTEK